MPEGCSRTTTSRESRSSGLDDGRPLFVRTPDSRLTLGNFVRAQLYGVFGTLSLGMRVLEDEGVALDRMFAHGGMFRTAGVAQRFLAGALDAPVAVGETASEGGAWGIAVLAAYLSHAAETDLTRYLRPGVRRCRHPGRRTVPRRCRGVRGVPRPLSRRPRRRASRRGGAHVSLARPSPSDVTDPLMTPEERS